MNIARYLFLMYIWIIKIHSKLLDKQRDSKEDKIKIVQSLNQFSYLIRCFLCYHQIQFNHQDFKNFEMSKLIIYSHMNLFASIVFIYCLITIK